MPYLKKHDEGVTMALKVQPGAPRSAIQGIVGDRLKVKIQAPPVEGKANKALIKWMAKGLGVKAGDIEILQGEKDSRKLLLVRGAEEERLRGVIGELMGTEE